MGVWRVGFVVLVVDHMERLGVLIWPQQRSKRAEKQLN